MITPERIAELRELASKATQVVSWYAHMEEVRGPYHRWFDCREVAPEYRKHVADRQDDCAFATAAMNNLVPLLDEIERLQQENTTLKMGVELLAPDWPKPCVASTNLRIDRRCVCGGTP